jgi:hypothetical protein
MIFNNPKSTNTMLWKPKWNPITTAPENTPASNSASISANTRNASQRQLLKTFLVIALVWLLIVAFAITKLSAQSTLSINPVSDLFTAQNTPVSASITIVDANPASVLMLAIADNPDLIPNENIVISQGSATRQLTITPTPGRTGTTVITLIGTNAVGQNAQITFNITVGGANPAPILSAIPATSTPQNQSVTVNFTLTDLNPSAVTVTASSDNANLVTQSGLVLSGSATARLLSVTPVFGQTGSAIITITATNTSGFSARQSFSLTVNRVDLTAPTITSPGDQVIAINQSGNAFFNVLDQSGVQNVNVFGSSSNPNLIPDANITISGIGSSRTVTMRPVAGRKGQANIILQALNRGGLSASTVFTLYVADPFDAPIVTGLRDTTILQNTTLVIPYTTVDANPNVLFLTPTSTNPDVIPQSGIRLTGTGVNRTFTITPNQNRFGEVPINLAVRNQNSVTTLVLFRVFVVAPPVLGIVPALSTRINTAVQGTLPVSDANPASVTFSVSSSNPDLVPNSNVSVSAGSTSRTVTVTPAPNRTGTVTITLTATNSSGLTAVTSFPVTVFQPQTPPSIGAIGAVATQRNVPVSSMFTVSDADVNSLRFSFTSSNPTVFPAGNIIVSGSGTTRIITLTPAPNATGSALITMTVTNSAGLSTTTSFTATAVPPPAPPSLSAIVNLTTERNRAVSMQFVLSDEDIASVQLSAASNNQALLPNSNLQISGFGTLRTLTITPGFNQLGSGSITVTAINRQGQTATMTVNVTVTPPNIPPTISPIGNVILGINQVTTRQVTVNDVNLNTLFFASESSNPTLILPTGLAISGSGGVRTLLVAPNANRTGTSEARITVTNQLGLSANTSFLVTVVPPPTITPPPVIPPNTGTIPNLVTRINTSTNSSFTVVDESGFPLRFTVTSSNEVLVPVGNVRLERDGNTVRVIITPAQDQTGRARVTVTVSNGFSSSSVSFDVEVLPAPVIPRIPFLIAPPNNSTGLSPNSNQFRWSSVPGAILYQVQIANDSLFQLIYLDNNQVIDTSWIVTTFNVERQYFWRARALFGLTPGDWSEVWTFRTGRVRQGGGTFFGSESSATQKRTEGAEMLGLGARLIANVPNPFSETTRIEYELGEEMDVRLEITDVLGKRVAELVNTRQRAGTYALEWDAKSLPSGVYICTLHTPKQALRRQMMIQR